MSRRTPGKSPPPARTPLATRKAPPPIATRSEVDKQIQAVSTKLSVAMDSYQRIARSPQSASKWQSRTATGAPPTPNSGAGATPTATPVTRKPATAPAASSAHVQTTSASSQQSSTPHAYSPLPPPSTPLDDEFVALTERYHHLIGRMSSPPVTPQRPATASGVFSTPTHNDSGSASIHANGYLSVTTPLTGKSSAGGSTNTSSPPSPTPNGTGELTSDPTGVHTDCIRRATLARRQRRRLLQRITELESQLKSQLSSATAKSTAGSDQKSDSAAPAASGGEQKSYAALRDEYETAKFADAERISSLEERIEQLTAAAAKAASANGASPRMEALRPPQQSGGKGTSAPAIVPGTIITVDDTSVTQISAASTPGGGIAAGAGAATAILNSGSNTGSRRGSTAAVHHAVMNGADWELERARYVLEIESLHVELETIRHEQKHGTGLTGIMNHRISASGTVSPALGRSRNASPTPQTAAGTAPTGAAAVIAPGSSTGGSDEWRNRYESLLSGHEKLLAEKDTELELTKQTQKAIIAELDKWKSTVQELLDAAAATRIANSAKSSPTAGAGAANATASANAAAAATAAEPLPPLPPSAKAAAGGAEELPPLPVSDPAAVAAEVAAARSAAIAETVSAYEKKIEVLGLEREAQKEVLLEQLHDLNEKFNSAERKHKSVVADMQAAAVESTNQQFTRSIAQTEELMKIRAAYELLQKQFDSSKRWQSKLAETELTRIEVFESPEHDRLIETQLALTATQQLAARLQLKTNKLEARIQVMTKQFSERIAYAASSHEQLRALWNAHSDRNQSAVADLEQQIATLTAIALAHEHDAEGAIADLTATRMMLKGLRRQTTLSGAAIAAANNATAAEATAADESSAASSSGAAVSADEAAAAAVVAAAAAASSAGSPPPAPIPDVEPASLPVSIPVFPAFGVGAFILLAVMLFRSLLRSVAH